MSDEELSFKDKLKTLNFGIVPGGYKDASSTSMYDRDALLDQIGHPDGRGSRFSKERVEDARSDVMRKIKEVEAEA